MLSRLEQYIFYIFLFSIPLQVRKILYFPEWRFNEWQAVSVYWTDILLVALFVLWLVSYFKDDNKFLISKSEFLNKFQNLKFKFKNPRFYLVIFLIVSAISIKNSSAFYLSLFQWLKLAEFVVFYFYLKNYAFKNFDWLRSVRAIIAGGVFQAIIGIVQFLKQSSIGLWFLDESSISLDLRGTAYFLNEAGDKIVRAYGTTPHPNVLAGYFLLVVCSMYYVLCKKSHTRNTGYLILITYCLILFAFFLTFSRVVILAWAIAFMAGIIFYRKKYPAEIKKIFLVTLLVACLFAVIYWPEIIGRLTIPSDDEGLVLRKYYADESLKSGLSFFGIGIGNFINLLIDRNPYMSPWLYQPVHNVYLLIYSEIGLVGISTFLLFLFLSIKKSFPVHNSLFLILTSCFLFIGLFDHFLWTLQQGRLIFWLALSGLTMYINKDRPPITDLLQ